VSTCEEARFIQSQSIVYIPTVKPRTKFLIGGTLVLGTAGYLAASAIKDTGVKSRRHRPGIPFEIATALGGGARRIRDCR
jgi:hypothetical protein